MEMKLKYFGVLSEITGLSLESMDTDATTVDELQSQLHQKYPAMKLVQCMISVNQQIADSMQALKEGDEIAVLPPFSGG